VQSSFRHVAVQRMLGVLEMALLRDTEGRSTPAKVYPVADNSDTWIVEPPINESDAATGLKTFTGHSALLKALEYAHCNYGSALYLSR
jgi:hypothetical protein